MNTLDAHLGGLRDRPSFFLYRLDWNESKGKYDKRPCTLDGRTWPVTASANLTDYATAQAALQRLPRGQYALGFWFAAGSGYWFLDIDQLPGDYQADDRANTLLRMFPGAFVEWSSSKRGIHIIGRADSIPHCNRNDGLHLELYSANRGICFGLDGVAAGSVDTSFDLASLVANYFPPRPEHDHAGERRPEWRGPEDDGELLQRALSARVSAAAAFGGKATFAQLWGGEVGGDDRSSADMALAAHLAFWTGCDAERIERLMWRSGLVRDKWREHRTYLRMTIANACARCENVYQEKALPPLAAGVAAPDPASPTSDLANAKRLIDFHGTDLMFVPGIGWHVWKDGGPWSHDDHAASLLAFGIGKAVQAEADALNDWVNDETINGSDEQKRRADVQKSLARWARQSEFVVSIRHTLEAAEPRLCVKADALDASPLLVGMPSGVLDLATCTMREHRQADRITKRIACDYNPAASAPTWQRFVHEILAGDAELIAYLQTLCGYMLSGKRGEHLLPVFHGTGANGKSTLLSTLQALFGDYAGTAAPGLLVTRNGSEHPTGLAALQGRRLVVVSETGEAGRLNEEQVKQLTGGDRITARRMRQDFYEFDPTHLIVLQTNHKPRVNGTDEGIWRRLKLIPFAVTIAPERRDPELPQNLLAELPGILSWAVEGWRAYQANGFREPEAVRIATADYRSASDQVGQFIAERCVVGPEHTATASAIYAAYKIWCAEHGEHPVTQRSLGLRLSERPGIEQARTTQARGWRGLAIAPYAVLGQSAPTLALIRPG